jgi:FKBP-type peptidyl-prolyl cis-trans isomerase
MKLLSTALALFIWSFSFGQDTVKTPTGLQIITLEKGEAQMPKVGQEVKVKYVGFLENGQIFEESDGGFKYILGDKTIIPGWNEALQLMHLGEKAVIILPPYLAYGAKGSKDQFEPEKYSVPPNATILFEITLLKIK